MKFNLHITCIGLLSLACIFFMHIHITSAEVTRPLYTVDYKPQVMFGDSGFVGEYSGLQNYVANYVGGYAHMTFTTTHWSGYSASYPAYLYVNSSDPTVSPGMILYRGIAEQINTRSYAPSDVYVEDIQFSATGYRQVVTEGTSTPTVFADNTVAITGMDRNTFISLVNDYPLQSPSNERSMAFQPMRLTEYPPSHIVSFIVSTSTRSVMMQAYISPTDTGAGIQFSVASTTDSDQALTVAYDGGVFYPTSSGDISHTWVFPSLATSTLPSLNPYIFSSAIVQSGATLDSTSTTLAITSPLNDYPWYGNNTIDAPQGVPSSYNNLVQTLGTGLSGTLSQIDIMESNPSAGYYGINPILMLYECPDDSYGGVASTSSSATCTQIYGSTAYIPNTTATTTVSFNTGQIILDPTKYYAFIVYGTNAFNALPIFYGSTAGMVDGACYENRGTSGIRLCEHVADLAFYLYGVTKASTPPTPTGYSSVLFLPGIEASRLYKLSPIRGETENRLWEPDNDTDVKNLYMDDFGKSIDTDIYTRDVLDEAYLPVIGPNIYASFLSTLNTMKSNGQIADYSAVPYDWRLSIDDILHGGVVTGTGDRRQITYTTTSALGSFDPYIISELRRLVASSKSGKVTIVTHSNGGLVAKALLKQLSDAHDPLLSKIDRVIMVAVPQLGTPAAIAADLHGKDQGLPADFMPFLLSKSVARGFAVNSPMAYNLLPSNNYFTYVDTPVVTFDSTLPDWSAQYGSVIHSQDRLQNFLLDTYGRVAATSTDISTPDTLHAGLLSQAQDLHAALDDWVIPLNIDVVEIAGWGVPTTMSGIAYTQEHGVITPKPISTIDGDGTVTTPSALWSGGRSVERYWVNLNKRNQIIKRVENGNILHSITHAYIFDISEFDKFITDTITKNTQPLADYTYLSTSTPTTKLTDTRLIYELHSPLALNLYDDQGRHTGISTTTGQVEEQIPGSYYSQLGDSQYIYTDTSIVSHVIMSGFAAGTFTFSVEELSGDTEIASTTFKDIPTSTTTRVTLTVAGDIVAISPMNIDSDSDGNTDVSILPVANGIAVFVPSSQTPPVSILQATPNYSSNALQANGAPIQQAIVLTDTVISPPIPIIFTAATSTPSTTVSTILHTPTPNIHTVKLAISHTAKPTKIEASSVPVRAPDVLEAHYSSTKNQAHFITEAFLVAVLVLLLIILFANRREGR